ncbi:hypothetical protein [Luteibacter sp. E-22]|uniref:hypothetical protein n=1 Tax=Luteibacter sp. E-22 TaxID=3404050 RepID=UPI003CE97935
MMKPPLKALLVAASLILSNSVCSSELSGPWILSIENPEHRVVATLKVKFTDEQAQSCISGDWKVLEIVSSTTQDKNFFPISDPLSYQIEKNQLTIGRNEVCDAYLWLKGPLGGPSVKGDYFRLGLGGGTPLGYFNLDQAR